MRQAMITEGCNPSVNTNEHDLSSLADIKNTSLIIKEI